MELIFTLRFAIMDAYLREERESEREREKVRMYV
jgi:hypothetical protein